MDEKLRRFYLESQVKNASPGQMLIMLYDALIQNAEQADTEISSSDNPSAAAPFVSRCIDIMRELSTCLRHEVDPSLCGTLSKLYLFFTREFSEAFEKREAKRIRAILPLIRQLRDAWTQAHRKVNRFETGEVVVAA